MALPAVYAEIAQHFQLTPGDLGGLGLARGIFESICALPAGFLADRLPRPRLIALGCNIWALGLVGCAFSPNLRWMIIFRAVNGVGLGIVQPLLFSLIADKSGASGRGRAFGFLLCTGNLGQTAFTACATAIAPLQLGGVAGWQCALILISALSALIGLLVLLLVTDTAQVEQRKMLDILRDETPRLGQIFCLPTFLIIIGQGIFGTAPWFAFSYLTMWLELNCFSNAEAASIYMCFNLGTALSNALGGVLLDVVCRRFPDHGPPAMAQSAVFASIPLFGLIFFGLGQGVHGNITDSPQHVMLVYCFTFFITGTLIASTMMNNNKMFSDVVPRENYTYVYALDRAIEGTFGAFGQPIVGWLADHIFHFDPSRANTLSCSPEDASSLAQGIYSVCAIGCVICFLFYSLAHYTYPRDRQRALQATTAKSQASKSAESSDEQSL